MAGTLTLDGRMAAEAIRDAVAALESRHDYAGDTFTHENGSVTVILWDTDPAGSNPREDYGTNVATLVQTSRDYVAVDDDAESLGEVWDRVDGRFGWRDVDMMRRYLAAWRPDILFFDTWDTGSSRGFGYVTAAAWNAAMGEDYAGDVTPADVFRGEVDAYGQWCRGEVYAGVHVTLGAPVVAYGAEGAYVDHYAAEEDTCYGFLGYDDAADIAASFTDSPVVGR